MVAYLGDVQVCRVDTTVILVILESPRKWRKCNLVLDNRLCGQQHGLAMIWVHRPRTSADEQMLSGRRAVVIIKLCYGLLQGLVVFH